MKDRIWKSDQATVHVLLSLAGVSTAILLKNGPDSLLWDCGDGALFALLDSGETSVSLSAVVISHGHYDHIGGLYSLIGHMRTYGRTEALHIYFPAEAAEPEELARLFLKGREDSMTFEVCFHGLSVGEQFDVGSIRLAAFEVVHRGSSVNETVGKVLLPAFGYVAECGEKKIVYSGDTGPCEQLREACRDADLAMIEATFGEEMDKLFPTIDEEKKKELCEVHMSAEQAREMGAGAKETWLIHPIRGRG